MSQSALSVAGIVTYDQAQCGLEGQ